MYSSKSKSPSLPPISFSSFSVKIPLPYVVMECIILVASGRLVPGIVEGFTVNSKKIKKINGTNQS
jgi:hypothetical protein